MLLEEKLNKAEPFWHVVPKKGRKLHKLIFFKWKGMKSTGTRVVVPCGSRLWGEKPIFQKDRGRAFCSWRILKIAVIDCVHLEVKHGITILKKYNKWWWCKAFFYSQCFFLIWSPPAAGSWPGFCSAERPLLACWDPSSNACSKVSFQIVLVSFQMQLHLCENSAFYHRHLQWAKYNVAWNFSDKTKETRLFLLASTIPSRAVVLALWMVCVSNAIYASKEVRTIQMLRWGWKGKKQRMSFVSTLGAAPRIPIRKAGGMKCQNRAFWQC